MTQGTGPFTVEWTGSLLVPATGPYTFAVRTVGHAEIWLDGRQTLGLDATLAQQDDVLGNVPLSLTAGAHAVRLLYRAPGWRAPIYWYWTPPGGAQTIIPCTAFLPALPMSAPGP